MGRSFKISARSQQFPSPNGSKISDRYGVREIKTGFDQKKIEIAKRKPEKKEREKIKSECIEED